MAATDKNMTFDVNLLPTTTGDHNLGSSDKKWNLYVNQINGVSPVTGVKGNAETNYRTGQVNLTPANVGAVSKSGDTMTGILNIKPPEGEGAEFHLAAATANTTENGISLDNYHGVFRVFGIASADGTTKKGVGTPLEIDPYAKTIKGGYTITGNVSGTASNVTGTVAIEHGGTGATTAAGARTNLGLGTMATETATNYLKWQSTSKKSTELYDFGVYVSKNNAAQTGPRNTNYYSLINIPYYQASGYNKLYYGWQIGGDTNNNNRLWFRTTGDAVYGEWQEIAHAPYSTNDIGSATQPVYMAATGVITAGTTYAGGTAVTLNNASKAGSTASFYAPTAGGTANTQALVGNGATSAPKWVNISPSISITAGTSSVAPTINVTVLGQSGSAQAITTASTSVYGVTKLQDGISSTSTALAATANAAYTASHNSLHTLATTTKYYITGTTSSSTSTGGDSFDTGVYVTTTAGELSAVRHSFNIGGTEKANMRYDNDIESIVFSFV